MEKQKFTVAPNLLIILLVSLFIMAAGDGFIKYASGVPLWEKTLIRSLFGLIPAYALKFKNKEKFILGDLRWQIVRAVSGLACMLCCFYAVVNMDLGDFSLLKHLSPVFLAVGGVMFFKEKVSGRMLIALAISFIGTPFIIKPAFEMSGSLLAPLAAIGGAITIGAIGVADRGLGQTNKTPSNTSSVIIFYLTFCALVSVPFALPVIMMPNPVQWGGLFGQATFSTVAQLMVVYVYQRVDVTKLGIYDYTTPVWSMIIGLALFGEHPTAMTFIGAALIIGGGVINALPGKTAAAEMNSA